MQLHLQTAAYEQTKLPKLLLILRHVESLLVNKYAAWNPDHEKVEL